MAGSIRVKTNGLEQNGTSFNTQVGNARSEDEWSWRLRGEEMDFCVTDDGAHYSAYN